VTPLEQVNEKIHDITELVRGHLQDFLAIYGITLNDVKVLIRPSDERMRELISLRAFGLSEMDAVRYYVAMKMAERGLVSAPNIAVGQPFNIGLTGLAPVGLPGLDGAARGSAPAGGRPLPGPAARSLRVPGGSGGATWRSRPEASVARPSGSGHGVRGLAPGNAECPPGQHSARHGGAPLSRISWARHG
jgi:hypothetical protein